MTSFDARPSPRLLFGPGRLAELDECVKSLGASRPLIVTDPGIVAAGHVSRATTLLEKAGNEVTVFEGAHVNPTESDIERCRAFAAGIKTDLIIGLGGGSSLDTAKGCNFLLHNGGRMSDYRGYGHADRMMLPFIAIPTTAGTGSECQSYAVVSKDETHEKIACGDPKALAKVAILDPDLTASQPAAVAKLTALDALSHAIESAVCTKRNSISSAYALQAFELIASVIEAVLAGRANDDERGRMLLGAAMAGSAIENSMLGGAHATANPLTTHFQLSHGQAVWTMLPHVVRFNQADLEAAAIYDKLGKIAGTSLPEWLDHILAVAELPKAEIDATTIGQLATEACDQWTGKFNPRPLQFDEFRALYQSALATTATP